MTRMTLLEQIDAMDWTEDSFALFAQLVSLSPTDESGVIVLAAAAVMLARQHPSAEALPRVKDLAVEFGELVLDAHEVLTNGPGGRPQLRLVGDADLQQAESPAHTTSTRHGV